MTGSGEQPHHRQSSSSFFCRFLQKLPELAAGGSGDSSRRFKILLLWTGGLALLLASMVVLIKFNGYYIQLMAAIAVAGCGILFYFAGIRQSFHLVLLSLPLSVNLPATGEHQLMFPSELLVVALGISVVIYWVRNTDAFLEWSLKPLTIAIGCYLFFVLISVFFSEMIIVSVKSVIVKSLYIVSFYGGGFLYFKEHKGEVRIVEFYLIPLLLVIAVVLFRHAEFSFSKDVTGYVTKPFYRDHTIYSAALAFLLPLVAALSVRSYGIKKFFMLISAMLLTAALFFAASRAAWLSVVIALVAGAMISARFPRKGFVLVIVLTVLAGILKSDDLVWQLKSNRYDSSARNAGIEEQTRSVTNITNDQSNAERINRWKCALRMFQEKPLTGFGPGTYQFSYFPFQRENEMTRISVKSPYNIAEGRGGTAHNEFLLVFAESGAFAGIAFLVIVLLTLITAFNATYEYAHGFMNAAMLLAFITFIVHSLFNNFLDTDKTAVLFFIAIAFFAALENPALKPAEHER